MSTLYTSITFPNSLISIGKNAFTSCSGLTSITFPSSLTSIGDEAFSDCYRLYNITCLNPVPPTCGIRTFYIGIYSRDHYDVYNYAFLHVPMGSEEIYSAANDWRYFERIKEDMELNGNVYYANLTVKQGTLGYTRQAMKADEKFTIFIGSLNDYKINAVTFNGEDVTEQVVDGYYTTPEIKGESVLSISYELPSSQKSIALNNVRVTGYNGVINVQNIDELSDVSIYTTDGELIDHIPSAYGAISVNVMPEQLYIVKVGNQTYKIAL